MHLSFLPDEATSDFAAGLRLGADLGLQWAEVRLVDGVNVLDMSDAQVRSARQQLDDHGMSVSAIATPFFKCQLPGRATATTGPLHGATELSYQDHLDLLARGVEIAQALGAPAMRIFSFWRIEDDAIDFWQDLETAAAAAVAATAGSGITPCLENEGACFIGTSAELAEAARRLPDPALKFIWDPGNSTYRGWVPRAEDFGALRDRIALVHLKDAVTGSEDDTSQARLLGEGETDFHAQLRWLAESGYDGVLTLEPHHCPDGDCVAGMTQSVAAVRRIAQDVGVLLT